MQPLDINVQEDNLFNQKVNEKKQTLPESRIINSNSDLFMYWSKGNPEVNLNCKKKDANKDKIACRHLAPAQLIHDKKSLNSVSYHEAFKNLTEIPFLHKNIADTQRIDYKADSYHVINTSNIGQKLAELVLANPPQENKPLLILFHSQNHVMSIKIKCRGALGFVVQFYDPNDTLAHKQIWFSNAESIAKLTLSHLMSEYRQQYYLLKFTGVISTYSDRNFSDPSTSTFHAENDISDSGRLHYALTFGQASAVVAAMQDIFNSNSNNAKKEAALRAKNSSGDSGLYMALHNGHPEAVKAYVNAILESNLETEQKQNLLAAGNFACPGLSVALYLGHHETVIVYVKAILESNLNKEQKQKLLGGPRVTGSFGDSYICVNLSLKQLTSLDNTKKIILDYLKFSLADKKTTTNDKIDLLFNAINPRETIGQILFTSNSVLDFTLFQSAKARLTAGSLNTVMMLIKNLNINLDNDEDKAYLKQKCQGITNVVHREYVNTFLFANDTPEILNAPAPRMA